MNLGPLVGKMWSNPWTMRPLEIVGRSLSCLMHPCLGFYAYFVRQQSAPSYLLTKALDISHPVPIISTPLSSALLLYYLLYSHGPCINYPVCINCDGAVKKIRLPSFSLSFDELQNWNPLINQKKLDRASKPKIAFNRKRHPSQSIFLSSLFR